MAFVTDLTGNLPQSLISQGRAVDYRIGSVNTTLVGSPYNSYTPKFVGELVVNTIDWTQWRAIGLTSLDWELVTATTEAE